MGDSTEISPRIKKAKRVQLQTLRAKFETLKMQSLENIVDYVTRLQTVVNEMKRNGKTPDKVRVMEKLLRSLTCKSDYVVTAIEESKVLSKISLDELMGSLQAHEARLNRSQEKSEETAFQVKVEASFQRDKNELAMRGRGRGGFRGRGHGKGHGQGYYQG